MHLPHKLETVIGLLDRHHQRASYAAFAALLGVRPQSLMKGLPRAPRYSWIVEAQTGVPAGYAEGELHPALRENDRVIYALNDLLDWLDQVK